MKAPSTTASDFDSCHGATVGIAVSAVAVCAITAALFLSIATSASAAPTAKPAIDAFFSSNVTATSADLHALINPQGGPATYRFEYGKSVGYGAKAPIPDGAIPSGTAAVKVTASISGLDGGIYHFRVVAENEEGTTTTDDQTFNFYPPSCPNEHLRQQTGASFLPDCRAYELVTPPDLGNALLAPAGPIGPSATSPSRFSFSGVVSGIPGTGDPQNANSADVYVATRSSEGWTTRYVGLPGDQGTGHGGTPNGTIEEFGVSLAGGGQPSGFRADQSLSTLVDWSTGRQGYVCCGSYGSFGAYAWNSKGESLGRLPTNLDEIPEGDADVSEGGFVGAAELSPDGSHYFFSSANVAFTPDGLTKESGSVYDNDIAADTVTKISVLSNGEDIPHEPGALTPDYLNIPDSSTDGSHVLIEAPKAGICGEGICGPLPAVCSYGYQGAYLRKCPSPLPSHLYMRVEDEGVTYDLSGSHATTYHGMTEDGSKVFFSSPGQVTADDTDTSRDLFVWDENSSPHVTRISAGPPGVGNTDSCTASWIAGCGAEFVLTKAEKRFAFILFTDQTYSDDPVAKEAGDNFFYSPELLDGGHGIAGERNLYFYRDGDVRFVSTLTGGATIKRIQISPDGDHAAFLTEQQMTAYNNTSLSGICTFAAPFSGKVSTGPRCLEIYKYDTSSGNIRCASCRPNHERPAGDAQASQNGRFMTDDGRVFFSTPEPLTPPDADGLHDTYEFVENRPQLISSGTSTTDSNGFATSGLIGVSHDGTDVYFSTTSSLVGQDKTGLFLKFYDARTGGGFPYAPPAAPCAAADECHGPAPGPPPGIAAGTSQPLGDGGNQRQVRRAKHRKKRNKKSRRHGRNAQVHKASRTHG